MAARKKRKKSPKEPAPAEDAALEPERDASLESELAAGSTRPVIAPLPSLPDPPPAEEVVEEKPQLRLAGERQSGAPLAPQLGPDPMPVRPLKRGIPMPDTHVPRQLLGDAAALFEFARHDRAEDIARLIQNGADPDLNDDPGNVHREAVTFMCQNEDIGEEGSDEIKFGRTASHMAAVRGHMRSLKALIDGGCNVNVVDHAGKAPLMRAARMGFLEIVRMLVEAGAEVDARDLRQSTALLRAAGFGHADVVRFLLDHGADPNAQDCQGRSALALAAAGVHLETTRALVMARADTSLVDATGTTALSAAVDAVEPADPNAPSTYHVVREERVLPVVALLLEAGARDAADPSGRWHSQRAEERGHPQVAALLRQQS